MFPSVRLACLSLVLLLASCASRLPTRTQLRAGMESPFFQTEVDIASIRALRPQLEAPFRLAIAPLYRRDAFYQAFARFGTNRHGFESWDAETRDMLLRQIQPFQDEGQVGTLVFLPWVSSLPIGGDAGGGVLRSLRQSAARVGADAVLLLQVEVHSELRPSVLSFLDLALLPMFLIESYTATSRVILEGQLLDVDNAYVYATASADGEAEESTTLAGADMAETMRPALLQAMEDFSLELQRQF